MEIIFHIGPRKCGKSLFVENHLNNIEKKLYIGTLDNSQPQFHNSIVEHQVRRDSSWVLYEITNDLGVDIKNIADMLAWANAPTVVMLDGIITWLTRLIKAQPTINSNNLTQELVNLVRNSKQDWYLVDVDSEAFENSETIRIDYKSMHLMLIKELNIKSIINWNYE
jgi:adenosyl cobinamide kinase/adenosyl cobinamide phosphate guanylyltransferase